MTEPRDHATKADLDALRSEIQEITAELKAAVTDAHADTKAHIDVAIMSLSELIVSHADSD
ncbi:MAG: hypothetical protein OXG19_01880 [Chloroflexi bacterium]|nr:hypothetical protein [Chloroflexota bacterium]